MSTATLQIEKKIALVPKLRFQGFESEWEKRKLGELAEKIGDGLHGTPIYSDDSDIYFINGNNLTNGKIEITEKTKKVDYAIFKKNDKGLNENTILISLNGTIGNIAKYNNEKVMLGKSVGYYNFKEKTDFYYHIFHTDKIQNFFISELTGSTIKNLSLKTLRETIISFPSLLEQQKIASFLSAVDEKIQQLSRKKELLEQYKKGVMQQLFSGKLRFKDENGNNYPDWEEKAFGAVTKFINGKAYKQAELLSSGKYRVLRVGNLFSNNEWYHSDLELEKDKYIEKGDLIYAWSASFGPRFWEEEKIIYHYHIWKVVPNHHVNKYFLYHAFMFDVERLKTQSQGGTMFHITKGNIESRLFNFPCVEEQQKIANLLSSIDTKIESVNQQLAKTQTFKKGLLQQLFV